MAVVHPSVFQVMKRFPEQRGIIVRRYSGSESFRALCDDYKQCSDALQFWNCLGSNESSLRQAEYEELLQSLESEILLYMQGGRLKSEEG